MLYLEQGLIRGPGWLRVFSSTDKLSELQKFRCLVRAPRAAIIFGPATPRPYLILRGSPRNRALLMIPKHLQFATPMDRVLWEQQVPEIAALHKTPFIEEEYGSGYRAGAD